MPEEWWAKDKPVDDQWWKKDKPAASAKPLVKPQVSTQPSKHESEYVRQFIRNAAEGLGVQLEVGKTPRGKTGLIRHKATPAEVDRVGLSEELPYLTALPVGRAAQTVAAGVSAYEGVQEARKGNYGTAALNLGLTALPFVPRAVKSVAKKIKGAAAAEEFITDSAFRTPEGKVETGANHPEILKRLGVKGFRSKQSRETEDFGFVTNKGRFVTRQEAHDLAVKTGQKLKEPARPGQIHSNEISQFGDKTKTIGEGRAVKEGQVQEGRQPEHKGVPPGADVPGDKGKVREGEGGQTGRRSSVKPTAEVKGKAQEVAPGKTTGIAERVQRKMAAQGRAEPYKPGEGTSAETAIEQARQRYSPAKAEQRLADMKKGIRGSLDQELGDLRIHHEKLSQATNKAADKYGVNSPQWQAAFKKETQWYKDMSPFRAEWAKAGSIQQGETDIDTGSFTGVARSFVQAAGRPMSKRESDVVTKLTSRVSELETQLASRGGKPKLPKLGTPEFGSKNTVFTQARYEAAKARFLQKTSRLSAGVDPTLVADMVEMGGYYVEGGVRSFADWSKAIRQEIPNVKDDVLRAAWDQLNEKKRLQLTKSRMRRDIDAMQDKLARGDATKPARERVALDEEGRRLEAEKSVIKARLEAMVENARPKSFWTKAAAVHREMVLSGYSVFEKLFGATVWGYPTETAADIVGSAGRKLIPGYTRLAEISGREGAPLATTLKGAVKGGRALFSRESIVNSWDTIRHGVNAISAEAGVKPKQELGGYIGRIHGAEKAFLQTAEYNRAGLIRTEMAAKAGLDINNPEVKAQIGRDAAIDAWNQILQGDNKLAEAINNAIGGVTRTSPAAGALMRTFAQVTKVPANILGRGAEMTGAGIPRGAYLQVRAAMRARAGIEVTPKEAAAIIRAYKYGGLGLAAAYLGWNQPKQFQSGGWYTPDTKGKGELGPDELKIAGVKIPRILAHSPFAMAVQFWATLRNAYNRGGAPSSLSDVASGIAEQTPGVEAVQPVAQSLFGREASKGKAAGTYVRSLTEPQLLQQIAAWLDGNAKRKPRGFKEELKMGVPGLRKQVPLKSGGGYIVP